MGKKKGGLSETWLKCSVKKNAAMIPIAASCPVSEGLRLIRVVESLHQKPCSSVLDRQ